MDVSIEPFRSRYLPEILELCEHESWPSLPEDPARAERALTAPGVTTVVAIDGEALVGFAQVLSDGEIQAYLALVAVAAHARGQGIGRDLIDAAVTASGAGRVDLLAEDGAVGFYERLPHRRRAGYRLYPPLDEPLPETESPD